MKLLSGESLSKGFSTALIAALHDPTRAGLHAWTAVEKSTREAANLTQGTSFTSWMAPLFTVSTLGDLRVPPVRSKEVRPVMPL